MLARFFCSRIENCSRAFLGTFSLSRCGRLWAKSRARLTPPDLVIMVEENVSSRKRRTGASDTDSIAKINAMSSRSKSVASFLRVLASCCTSPDVLGEGWGELFTAKSGNCSCWAYSDSVPAEDIKVITPSLIFFPYFSRISHPSIQLDFGHFPRNRVAGKWQLNDSFIAGHRRLSNFMMSICPPDFA